LAQGDVIDGHGLDKVCVFQIRCLRICDFTIPRGLPILWLLDRQTTYSGG
jgi:hypothetical protein